jgi:serine/threonine-protein kinase
MTGRSTYALPETIGGYRVLRRISKGGMGEVLLGAREGQHGFSKRVAIKVVLPHLVDDEAYKTMFFDEARLASRLSHPNVCQVFDFGEDQGVWYLVMEYVDGVPLENLRRAHAAQGTRPPPELAALLVAQAARGLHHAHSALGDDGRPLGVVHRDVSPQNLLVTYDGCTKLLDFGIARSRGRERVTQMGVVRGKPGYMAPEQTVGEELDARTDIFQLGIVLWELLTSEELFVRENIYHSIRAVMEEDVPDVRDKAPGIDDGYAHVLAQALARDRAQRFSNADAFARALDEVINRAGRPVTDAVLADHVRRVVPRPPEVEGRPPRPQHVIDSLPTMEDEAPPQPHGRVEGAATAVLGGGAPGRPQGRATAVVSDPPATSPPSATPVTVGEPPASLKVIVHDERSVGERIGEPSTAAYLVGLARRRRATTLAVVALLVALVVGIGLVVTDGAAPAPEVAKPSATEPSPPSPAAPVDEVVPPPPTAPAAEPEETVAAAKVPTKKPTRRRARPAPAARPPPKPVEPAPKAPVAQPAAAEGHGYLRITKEGTWANVRVDGKMLGSTPILRHRVPAGHHVVEVLAADTGDVLLTRKVTVDKDATRRVHVK